MCATKYEDVSNAIWSMCNEVQRRSERRSSGTKTKDVINPTPNYSKRKKMQKRWAGFRAVSKNMNVKKAAAALLFKSLLQTIGIRYQSRDESLDLRSKCWQTRLQVFGVAKMCHMTSFPKPASAAVRSSKRAPWTWFHPVDLEGSINGGTPKSSILDLDFPL